MPGTSRIVHALRLRAPGEAPARRAARLMEDALRTASLPDAGGRIVLVRRLALGRIDPWAPPQTLALAFERGVARAQARIVYADGDAPQAAAVWFRDALDAHTRLALRILAGETVAAWYWSLAVRAWRRGTPVSEAIRDIAFSLAGLPEAPSALPGWAAALCADGHAARLIGALRHGDAAPLAAAARLDAPPPGVARRPGAGAGDAHARAADAAPLAAPATRPAASRAVALHGHEPSTPLDLDPRRALLRALLRRAGMTAARAETLLRAGDPGLRVSGPPPGTGGPKAARRVDDASASRRDRSPIPGARIPSDPPGEPVASIEDAPRARTCRSTSPFEAARATATHVDSGTPHPTSATFDGATTGAGGLLFLVPVLVRLGYPEWISANTAWAPFDLARRLFARVLVRLAVGTDDPASALAAFAPPRRAPPRRFVAPAAWPRALRAGTGPSRLRTCGAVQTLWDGSGRLLYGAWRDARPRALAALGRDAQLEPAVTPASELVPLAVDAWLVASRRWLRRSARIGLADLVSRRAAIACTPTHLDVHFDLDCVDLRIRRAGLDLDPGWVPWLGRVVTFRYGR